MTSLLPRDRRWSLRGGRALPHDGSPGDSDDVLKTVGGTWSLWPSLRGPEIVVRNQGHLLPLSLFFFFGQESRIRWWAWVRRGRRQDSHESRTGYLSRGSPLGMYLTWQPWGMSCFSATLFSNSSTFNLVNPHFLEMWIFWWPENLNLSVWGASVTCSLFYSLVWMDITTWPLWTLASALGLFKSTAHSWMEPGLQTACQPRTSTGKGCLQIRQGQPCRPQATRAAKEAALLALNWRIKHWSSRGALVGEGQIHVTETSFSISVYRVGFLSRRTVVWRRRRGVGWRGEIAFLKKRACLAVSRSAALCFEPNLKGSRVDGSVLDLPPPQRS